MILPPIHEPFSFLSEKLQTILRAWKWNTRKQNIYLILNTLHPSNHFIYNQICPEHKRLLLNPKRSIIINPKSINRPNQNPMDGIA